MKSLHCVQLLVTPWTTAHQASPSMGLSRQEYWSGVALPSLLLVIQILEGCRLASPWVDITNLVYHPSPSMVATALLLLFFSYEFSLEKRK